MIAARKIANRWYSQVAGIALVAFGMVTVPAPRTTIHNLEDEAVYKLAPKFGAPGHEFLAMYAAQDKACHHRVL